MSAILDGLLASLGAITVYHQQDRTRFNKTLVFCISPTVPTSASFKAGERLGSDCELLWIYWLRIVTRTALIASIVVCSAGRGAAADLNRDAGDILSTRCLSCHGPSVKMAGLDLSSRASAVKGGRRGSVL